MVVAIRSQKVLLMCPYVSSGKFSKLAPGCSRALLHNLQPTSNCRLILQAIWLPEWSLLLPLFLAFYVSKGRTGRSNTSLRLFCVHFAATWSLPSTCHMQGDWYRVLPQLAHMIARIFFHQFKCPGIWPSPCFGTMPHIVTCVSSPLCHHLCIIFHIVDWVWSFLSKHL